jgi:hypothetical protein
MASSSESSYPTKTPEEIQEEKQAVWNTLSTPVYNEFVGSDQTEATYNIYLQTLKSNYADFKSIDIIISSFVKNMTYDASKEDWLSGLKAAEKSCQMVTDQGWIVMADSN